MLHHNIDIDTILRLLRLVKKPARRSNKLIRIAKGYYYIKKSNSSYTWLKR
jgi:hypothetical protein